MGGADLSELERRDEAIRRSLAEMDTIRRLLGEEPRIAGDEPAGAPGGDGSEPGGALELPPTPPTPPTTPAPPGSPHVVAKHEVSRTLLEKQLIPEHGQRRSSSAYRATHNRLIRDLHLRCLVCGVNDQLLGSVADNPFVATQMETHHRVVEWSLIKAVDLGQFNARVVPGLHRRWPDKAQYQQPMTQDQMESWIDADEDNMWVLCDVHHRHPLVGIHMISGPIWGPQDLLLAEFQLGRGAPGPAPDAPAEVEVL
jgi:hypothetical protein